MRPLLLIAALAACVPASTVATDAPTPTAEDLGPAPTLPAAAWVSTDGPIELAQIEVSTELAPNPQTFVDADTLSAALCESSSDRLRGDVWEDANQQQLSPGEMGQAEPGICYGPAWCAWALQTVQPAPQTALEGELEARLSRCRSDRASRWLASRSPYAAANQLLYDVSPGKSLRLPVLDELLRRIGEGEEIYLAVVLLDTWGTFDQDQVRTRILAARDASLITTERDTLGRALGLFAHADAMAAWRKSCRTAEAFTCEAAGEAPLIASEDLGQRLTDMAPRVGRYGLPAVLSRAHVDGLPATQVSQALQACMGQTQDSTAAEVCFEALVRHFPDDIEAALKPALTPAKPYWPNLRRRMRAAELGADGVEQSLRDAGMIPADVPFPRKPRGTDPIYLLGALDRGAPVFQRDASLDRLALLRRMTYLAGMDAIVHLPASDPYRPVVWFRGKRHTATLNRAMSADGVNASELAAVVNAVAAHHELPLRLLIQPAHTLYVQTYVVAGTPKALQASIDAGLLTAPVPDRDGWRRARAHTWVELEEEPVWDSGG